MPTWAAESWVDRRRSDAEHDLRPAVPGVDGLLDGGTVQGDQRELRGHEEGGAGSQSDAGKDE